MGNGQGQRQGKGGREKQKGEERKARTRITTKGIKDKG